MQLASSDLIEMTGCVIRQSTTTRSFNAAEGAKFRFFQCGIVLESGSNINNAAFVYASGNNVTGQYANLWVSDGRAAGGVASFNALTFTGHSVKNCITT